MYNRVQIKFDPFFILHDALFPTYPKSHDIKILCEKGKENFPYKMLVGLSVKYWVF